MKRTPIQRKTPIKSRTLSPPKVKGDRGAKPRAPLKQKRSTTTPTKAERAHIERIKQPGQCVACWLNFHAFGLGIADQHGCDAHHTLSGGRRRGHGDTLGLCPWHHRGVRPERFVSDRMATQVLGPSLAHGSKPFHALYGDDDYLLELQQRLQVEASTK